jgi:hypothetical protein
VSFEKPGFNHQHDQPGILVFVLYPETIFQAFRLRNYTDISEMHRAIHRHLDHRPAKRYVLITKSRRKNNNVNVHFTIEKPKSHVKENRREPIHPLFDVDDFVAATIPKDPQISTGFNRVGHNSLNRN